MSGSTDAPLLGTLRRAYAFHLLDLVEKKQKFPIGRARRRSILGQKFPIALSLCLPPLTTCAPRTATNPTLRTSRSTQRGGARWCRRLSHSTRRPSRDPLPQGQVPSALIYSWCMRRRAATGGGEHGRRTRSRWRQRLKKERRRTPQGSREVMPTDIAAWPSQAPEKRRVEPFFGSQASMRTEASFGLAKAQNQTTKQAQGGSSRPGQELATQPNRPNVSAPRK